MHRKGLHQALEAFVRVAQRVRRACGLAGVVGWPRGRGIGQGSAALARSRAALAQRHVPADRVNP